MTTDAGDGSDPGEDGTRWQLAVAAFDTLPAQVAVIDQRGTILATNRAWDEFGTRAGLPDLDTVGDNYLQVCDGADDETPGCPVRGRARHGRPGLARGHNRLVRGSLTACMAITLYQLDGCPYCEKVADRLDELGVDYDTEWVGAMHSERNEVKRVSGQRGVPVLVDDERGVTRAESERILEYVDATLA